MKRLKSHPSLHILSKTKSFADPWVGHPKLNRLGLHLARMLLSGAAADLRRLSGGAYRHATIRTLRRDGIAVVPNFLPLTRFETVRGEVRRRVDDAERQRSVESVGDRGFGPKRPFEGGFDRWDGDTLNRFLFIDQSMPHTLDVAREIAQLAGLAIGAPGDETKVWIYQTVHGRSRRNHDIQKDLHRDTFQPAVKLWYFLEDVELEQGPFVYVMKSNHLNLARQRWEYARANRACQTKNKSGAFRIDEPELSSLSLPAPKPFPVRANTLVVADVRGFHRRGDAAKGARRLSLYVGIRPKPFEISQEKAR